MGSWRIIAGDVFDGLAQLADESVHCVVTSPPYWRLRDYGVDGQIGLEPTLDGYLDAMASVFDEVRRVLRSDGTCWLNLGDTYANDGKWGGGKNKDGFRGGNHDPRIRVSTGLKPKDLCGAPWRVAMELQRRGWWLRSEVIWAKRSPMPSSVRDRPTTAHEHVFLLAKSASYFYDSVAASEPATGQAPGNKGVGKFTNLEAHRTKANLHQVEAVETRNARTVWTLSTEPFREAHFATYPTELVRRCLRAGVSERGVCGECGAPWRRLTERERVSTRPGENSKVRKPSGWKDGPGDHRDLTGRYDAATTGNRDPERHVTRVVTVGWEAGCDCDAGEPVAPVVLDPFVGAGTTIVTALRLGCDAIGVELNPESIAIAERRIAKEAAAGPLFAESEAAP